jgi:opacity protein-like surface antigen
MKKIILAAVAVLAFGFANAQEVKFGVKGGLNIATQSYGGEDAPSPSSLTGFHIGGLVEIKISDKFSIQPELLYSTQGSKFSMTGYSTENSFKLSYINIPVMLKYFVAEKFSLEAGPQIGFLTSSKMEVILSGITGSKDAKEIFKTVDFGLNIGAGYDFTKKISVNARYNFGLSNIAKNEDNSDISIKNGVFLVSVGYKF